MSLKPLLLSAAMMAFSVNALAAVSGADAARLGADLTPMGAEKAGNAAGTIPAWTGGITTPVAGFKAGGHYVDPFPSDKAKFEISAANMAQYAANLTPGRRLDFSVGNSFFRNPWVLAPSTTTARDGLGPLFNTNACQNCHIKDGRGHAPADNAESAVSMLLRLSLPAHSGQDEILEKLGVIPEPTYGGQLQDMIGKDTFIPTEDMVAALKAQGIVDKAPTSLKELAAVQAAFNQWHAESGRPLCQLSVMLAHTVNH